MSNDGVHLPGLPCIALDSHHCCSPFCLPFISSLRVLDVRGCASFDLTPLVSCRDLRRLYINDDDQRELDLKPLRGLKPRLMVKRGDREEYEDARDL